MIFETLAYLDGTIRHWSYHYARYLRGCIHFNLQPHPEQDLLRVLDHALPSHDCVIKFTQTQDSLDVTTREWPAYPLRYYTHGISAKFATTPIMTPNTPAQHKSTDRSAYQPAINQLAQSDAQELLLTTQQDYVIEGTKTNLFAVINGGVVTPDIRDFGVAGTMRQAILDYVRHHHILCEVRPIARQELLDAQHIFLSNAIIGIWPVASLEHKLFEPGRIYQQLFDGLDLSHAKV